MCPIKTTINILYLIKSCPHSAWLVFVSQPSYQLHESTYPQHCDVSLGRGRSDLQTRWSESRWLLTRWLFSLAFLPAMASDCSRNLELLKNPRVHNLLPMCSSTRTYWQWAGGKCHSLSSTHHVAGAYFLTTKSDKQMCLLTRLYDNNALTLTLYGAVSPLWKFYLW